MKKILVPTDFTDVAHHALHLAAQLAQQTGAEVELLHVLETTSTAPYDLPEKVVGATGNTFLDYLEASAREQLEKTARAYADVPIRYLVRQGSPFRAIDQRASEQRVDLIVMGSKGSSGLDELLIGSNAERVVRFAPCPVLVVKGNLSLAAIKKVVYVTDFAPEQAEAVSHFLKFMSLLEAEVHLLYINTPTDWITSRAALKKMEAFRAQHNLNAQFTLYSDATEEEGIHHFVSDIGAQLVAMPTYGRTGITRLIAGGSITENVLNHTRVALWTYRLRE
ncbi:Nucleotide-binding universal stress protein, UspA family [Catalinimonas alkaloidigena]|uniref:Nucleotide-binding universal stress protein, UspA family n=1 Tax=Catalinimonas alkaloidigena TaxID=1075417 RepID=A0A1G9IYU8_9BACT|nr:universal stress protein [Catalinimonas alkaloidigena]SDL30282.1 Nucleotide-binding universal stress protein, UspA family [Catalinimonas alkaloidigena]